MEKEDTEEPDDDDDVKDDEYLLDEDKNIFGKLGVRQSAKPTAANALDKYCYRGANLNRKNWPEVPHYYSHPIFQHTRINFAGPRLSNEAEFSDGESSSIQTPAQARHAFLLSKLTQEYLLKGEYDQAAFAMTGLASTPDRLPEQLWRVGLEILKECSPSMRPSILRFYSLMQALCEPYQGEIILDMAFYMLQRDKDIIQSYELLTGKMAQRNCARDPLVKAYVGLFEYVLWKIQINKDKKYPEFDVTHDRAGSESDEEVDELDDEVHFYAQRALQNLKTITESSGNWDMFLLKYIDLLDYHNLKEDAVKVLEEYRRKNPENPNAHRYLFWYLKKIKADKGKLREVLEDIVKMDPTSELAPELIEIWKEEGKMPNVTELLFARLDHPVCRASVYDWKELAVRLKILKKQPSDIESLDIQKCWDSRKEWWQKYHFVNINEGKGTAQKYIKKVQRRLTNTVAMVSSESSSDADLSPRKRQKLKL